MRLLAVLFVSLLFGCGTTPVKNAPKESSTALIKEFERIKLQINRESWEKSATRLQHFIAQNPESDLADDAAMTLGQLLETQRRYNEAYYAYMKVVDTKVESPLEATAMVSATHMLVKLGRPDEALGLSERALNHSRITPDQKSAVREHRYGLYQQLGQSYESILEAAWLAENASSADQRTKFVNAVSLWIDGSSNAQLLSKALGESQLRKYQTAIAFKLGVLAYEQKDLSRTRIYMEKVIDESSKSTADANLSQRAKYYLDLIDMRRKVQSDTIGLVVPLTGKYAKVGYKALRGVQLALGTFWSVGTPLKLAIVDSEGNSDVARNAIERLVNEDNVIGIIGGLTSKTALQEAMKSQELGVPFLALSQAQGLTEIGNYIFRNSVTSRNQVASLVGYAMDHQKMRNFAILYPSDPYGIEFATAFFDEVMTRGGQVRGIQTYDPKETDFRDPVRKLFGTYYPEERADEYRLYLKEWQDKNPKKGATPPDDLLPPIVDFDGLFVPDSARAVGQIAPMILYNNVKTVKLLGTNLWNSPDFLTRGQKFIEGAIFVDTLVDGDSSYVNSFFFAEFKSTFHEDPGLFEVLAYDAALLIRKTLMDGESSRVGVRDALANLKATPGATGPLTVSENREVTRQLHRLSVEAGKIIPAAM